MTEHKITSRRTMNTQLWLGMWMFDTVTASVVMSREGVTLNSGVPCRDWLDTYP